MLLDELLDARVLLAEPDWRAWRSELDRLLAPHGQDAETAMDTLRHFQHAQAFRLLAQDLAGQLTVERLAHHLSALEDTILAATLRCWWRQ
jgi:glutamate-ammonia-ligase adenylyltransferase